MTAEHSWEDSKSPDSWRVRRRRVLAIGASAIGGGVAGCSSQSDQVPTTDLGTPVAETESPTSTTTSGEETPDPALRGPWPTAHANPKHTSSVSERGPQGTPSVHWQEPVRLETAMQATTGPDGPVATQQDGTLVAYDHEGAVRWRKHPATRFAAAPVVAPDGTVVVGSRDGTVTAYDAHGYAARTRRRTRTHVTAAGPSYAASASRSNSNATAGTSRSCSTSTFG